VIIVYPARGTQAGLDFRVFFLCSHSLRCRLTEAPF
jgi:hypothetical protein